MVRRALRYAILGLLLAVGQAGAYDATVAAQAQRGFEEILDLWRAEDYEGLFARLDHPVQEGWPYFAQRIVYGSRIPACCWEKLQDVKVRVADADSVVVSARVGFEVEGVGTRFVVGDFPLRRRAGVWRLPMQVVLDLSEYNLQRIPRRVYVRPPG
jgi:hypothetical protein